MGTIESIAVVGGHGLVSVSLLKLIVEKDFEKACVVVYGSGENLEPIIINNNHFPIVPLEEKNIEHFDIVFMCVDTDISGSFTPLFLKKKCKIIDNSSFYRMEKEVPLVVPEINSFDLLYKTNLYSNPNCVAIMCSLGLKPLHDIFRLEKIIITSFQSVSGYGNKGLQQLSNEIKNRKVDKILPSKNVVKKSIYNNILPIIDDIEYSSLYTIEEIKIKRELEKILHLEEVDISTTAVRIPTPYGHGAAITAIFKDKVNLDDAKKAILECPYLELCSEPNYPSFEEVLGTSKVAIGRLRIDPDCEYTLSFFVTSDNVIRGASYNALGILERLMEFDII